ncbi:helix-turn-helix domain-containing protein [Fulvivirgaceae bacterium BMA10]|uniref:Helix-turn-helix domain-containing protein n=1 Tax=Splendidivirga corallicola TaxID=3051826 RepID=A0ABT8KH59_9BACT|nr:helix-turn-helix domain-containing protein [Fulvivirgaceae bacterium BMA10]
MYYNIFSPCEELKPFIKFFWILEDLTGIQEKHSIERVIPDGCMELIIHYGDRFQQYDQTQWKDQSKSLLAGQLKKFLLLRPTGIMGMVGARFHPNGAYPFFKIPMNEFQGHVIEADNICDISMLENKIYETKDHHGKVMHFQSFLLQMLHQNFSEEPLINAAVNLIVEQDGCIPITDVAKKYGSSVRQMERKFNQLIGISPKAFSNLVKLKNFFNLTETGRFQKFTDLAIECGYYDQAHFIREFKQITGLSPKAYYKETNLMNDFFWNH